MSTAKAKTAEVSLETRVEQPEHTPPPGLDINKWEDGKVYRIGEGESSFGVTYARGYGYVYAHPELWSVKKVAYGGVNWLNSNGLAVGAVQLVQSPGQDANSCAFCKIHVPLSKPTPGWIALTEWWLTHFLKITRGTLAYVTPKDGHVQTIMEILEKKGFQHMATNKSNHANYGVRLMVHPGDIEKKKEFPKENETYNPSGAGI